MTKLVYQTKFHRTFENILRMPKFVRTKWTPEQLRTLNEVFDVDTTPSRETRASLANTFNVTERNIRVWFQNTRQRGRDTAAVAASRQVPRSRDIEDIRLLATSVDVGDDAFSDEHVSSISMLVGVDAKYVRRIMNGRPVSGF